jgi:hypothetical protein
MLAVVGLAAATCSPALAESGAPDVPLPAVPDLAAAAATVLDDTTLQEVFPAAAAAGLPELEPVAAPLTTLPAVPAQETAAEPATGAVVAPPQEPVPAPAAVPQPDAPFPDAPPASVDQAEPTNVNVSVRIDSPGDNGSVDQVNAADADAVSQPDDPQPQPPPGESTAAPAAASPESPVPADASEWNWNWSWNCADPVPELPADPSGSMQNWIWNWDWDCGAPGLPNGNTSGQSGVQYQPGVSQYRPVNINISIRINSPGNDGPVRQTNIASATTTFVLPTIRIDASAGSVEGTSAPGAGPALVIAASMPVAGSVQAELTAPLLEFLFGAPSDPDGCCLPALSLGMPFGQPKAAGLQTSPAPDHTPRDITAPARFRASVEVTMRLTRASAEAAREARAASKPARTVRPAPRSRAADGTREPAVVLSSGFAPPLNASDGRLGYLFLFVAGIAFVFAFADATRSVAADVRATGEDPDPPPDRPG